jgi:hypothetical protein
MQHHELSYGIVRIIYVKSNFTNNCVMVKPQDRIFNLDKICMKMVKINIKMGYLYELHIVPFSST